MKGIITVVGMDRVGIIANLCNELAEHNVNILDISQTIVDGYFNMMMIVDLSGIRCEFSEVAQRVMEKGKEVGVDVKLQHEGIFQAMHRL